MADVKALLAAARAPERSVDVCLRGDLVASAQDLHRALAEAEATEKATGSLDGGRVYELAEQIDALREQMREFSLKVKVRAVPRRRWPNLVAEHPPRDDDPVDVASGFNRETFFTALVRESVVEPVLDDADWTALDEVLSEGQWQVLANAAWAVNARDVDIPFSPRASRILASSEDE